jgi:hypothetical protein
MLTKSLFLIVTLALFAFAATIFEAASATSIALNAISAAQTSDSDPVRQRLLDHAERTLRSSWARPLEWHAGATEALSAAYQLDGQLRGDPNLLTQSAFWAEKTVRLAPVQPHAWTRLAILAEQGHANTVCTLEVCLAKSWQTAPMIDPATGCARLQVAFRRNLLAADDPRIDAYLKSGPSRREAVQCLSFLPAGTVFQTMLRAQSRAN